MPRPHRIRPRQMPRPLRQPPLPDPADFPPSPVYPPEMEENLDEQVNVQESPADTPEIPAHLPVHPDYVPVHGSPFCSFSTAPSSIINI